MLDYVSVFTDHTGYGQAARLYLKGLDAIKADFCIKVAKFEPTPSEAFGPEFNALITKYAVSAVGNYSARLMHIIPDFYKELTASLSCKRIGYIYWESSKIVEPWANMINNYTDAMFVCCNYTKNSLENSGVKVPVYVIPPAFDTEVFDTHEGSFDLPGFEDYFKFYSIFQWTERKNPAGLLISYFTEFNPDDKVVLVIKTYGVSNGQNEVEYIKSQIAAVKNCLNLKYYPPIVLITDFLSSSQMISLHKSCDCFVLPNRSEGLGIPHIEAALAGNPVITTNHGSVPELFNYDKNMIYLVDAFEMPVCDMPSGWNHLYKGDQIWGDPDLLQVRSYMREVFSNYDAALIKSQRSKAFVKSNYNFVKASTNLYETFCKVI